MKASIQGSGNQNRQNQGRRPYVTIGSMSERDFHAEAVCRVAQEVAAKHPVPRPITWVELRINEDDTQACLVQIAVRECERNLRGDDLIRQMVEMSKEEGLVDFYGWIKAAEKHLGEGK